MNWGALLGNLGKIGAVGAAPFTGGSSLSLLPAIEGITNVAGGAARAGQAQNNTQANQQMQAEQNRLARDKFALDAPGNRLSTATRASLMGNFQPTKVSQFMPGMGLRGERPQITGGVAGGMANLDPRVKQLGSTVMSDALAAQKAGGLTGGKTDTTTIDPEIGKSSWLDKLMGGTALGGGMLAAILKGNRGPVRTPDIRPSYEPSEDAGFG